MIRIAKESDAEELLEIYAPYVENTTITFETVVPVISEFRERIRKTLINYPYLVMEEDGKILGFCYASPFKDRAAYDYSTEISIYVKSGYTHKGIGKSLYTSLENYLTKQNICNVCACIAYPNPASESFHKFFGFQKAAHFHRSGYKMETWIDIIWMEKELNLHHVPPKPFIPFSKLDIN